jgi:UDP-N-acetylglucosamine diphosphorylase / glucose-1-phosphate thymidylyltransferase / UDP-N-acetylgalactosamine diphosphorylase / glucosamine-1-phosphate N-acetyltransferase / galactosamine-1-phosphate N-acetyltransferase
MKIVVPMAGRGSRFKAKAGINPEYGKPKPIINVKGIPMVRWATGSLPFVGHKGQKISGKLVVDDGDLIFILLREHEDSHQISEQLKDLYGKRITVILIDQVTRGAAETALMAKGHIDINESVIISDSDHFFDGAALAGGIVGNSGIDGLIPVFEVGPGDEKWSFSRLGSDGYVDLVAEKKQISNWANIGGYYFSKWKTFVEAAEEMIRKNEMTKGEFYLAPVYNKIIEKGGRIKLVFPKFVYGLGTPEDVEFFISNCRKRLP